MDEDMLEAAREYAEKHGFSVGEPLGSGIHGRVWMLLREGAPVSALKIHREIAAYRRERKVYVRLKECGVREVRGLSVPELIRFDDPISTGHPSSPMRFGRSGLGRTKINSAMTGRWCR